MSAWERELTRLLAETLRSPSVTVAPTHGFADLGMDSMLGLRFARRIEDELGFAIELEWLFDHPSVRQLSHFLEQQFGELGERPAV
jgi:polyketide synthase PksN